jgi:hypothetical protein
MTFATCIDSNQPLTIDLQRQQTIEQLSRKRSYRFSSQDGIAQSKTRPHAAIRRSLGRPKERDRQGSTPTRNGPGPRRIDARGGFSLDIPGASIPNKGKLDADLYARFLWSRLSANREPQARKRSGRDGDLTKRASQCVWGNHHHHEPVNRALKGKGVLSSGATWIYALRPNLPQCFAKHE